MSEGKSEPWWRRKTRDELSAWAATAPIRELEALSVEMGAEILNIQTQLSSENPSLDWRRSANRAKSIVAEKRSAVRRVLAQRNNEKQRLNNGRRATFIEAARECVADGRHAEALDIILDLLDHRHTSEEGEEGAADVEGSSR